MSRPISETNLVIQIREYIHSERYKDRPYHSFLVTKRPWTKQHELQKSMSYMTMTNQGWTQCGRPLEAEQGDQTKGMPISPSQPIINLATKQTCLLEQHQEQMQEKQSGAPCSCTHESFSSTQATYREYQPQKKNRNKRFNM
jgi:hypothetical protein